MIVQNTCRPFANCFGNPGAACTFGDLIFMPSDYWMGQKTLQSHEYVHVLQWQQRGSKFLAPSGLGDYTYGFFNGGPLGSTEEAASYLWGAWISAFPKEAYPWKVWKPEPTDPDRGH
jgi:hypothetical protein